MIFHFNNTIDTLDTNCIECIEKFFAKKKLESSEYEWETSYVHLYNSIKKRYAKNNLLVNQNRTKRI